MVSPEIATAKLPVISKTREAWLPLTVSTPAPGPAMVRSLPMANSPELRVIVPVKPAWKFTVPPAAVVVMASRREPGPASSRLVTVLGKQRPSNSSTDKRQQ
jgi:hypothetical protein